MKQHSSKRNRGITLIELMISLGVMAILLALATPAMQDVGARSDIKEATDGVVRAFRVAKNAARLSSTNVAVTFTTNQSPNTITFAFVAYLDVNNTNISANGLQKLPAIDLPAKISVSSDTTVFVFDSMGMIDATGTITLASTINSAHASTVVINNTMGYVTASYAALGEGA